MATIVTWNGGSFTVPATGEENWGGATKVDGLLVSLATNGFQKSGGLFTLSADADFGASAGLKSIYYKSRNATPATAGIVRLAVSESMGWRNNANSGNLLFTINASDQLLFNGSIVIGMSPTLTINRALVSDGTGVIISSTVTTTELQRLSGVLSTVVGISDTNTLTNKKLSDSTCTFVDNGDATKQLAFECSGITSGQTRTWTVPDASATMVGHDTAQTLTNKTMVASSNTFTGLDFNGEMRNFSISATVAASALTVALKDAAGSDCSATSKAFFGMRSSTAATGTYNLRTVSAALSVVASSGSTLGQVSAVPGHVYVYVLDNAGTIELALSSTRYDDGSIVSTTAEGGAGAADSVDVIYSTTARASVPIRCIGRIRSTQATAGTWATSPAEVACWPFFTGKQIVIGAAQTGDASRSNAAFGAPSSNGPTVSFVAGTTGLYKVSFCAPVTGTSGNNNTFRINSTAGSPTVVFSQEACFDAVAGFSGKVTIYMWGVYFLTAGTSYTFQVEMKSSGAGAISINGTGPSNGMAMIAEQIC